MLREERCDLPESRSAACADTVLSRSSTSRTGRPDAAARAAANSRASVVEAVSSPLHVQRQTDEDLDRVVLAARARRCARSSASSRGTVSTGVASSRPGRSARPPCGPCRRRCRGARRAEAGHAGSERILHGAQRGGQRRGIRAAALGHVVAAAAASAEVVAATFASTPARAPAARAASLVATITTGRPPSSAPSATTPASAPSRSRTSSGERAHVVGRRRGAERLGDDAVRHRPWPRPRQEPGCGRRAPAPRTRRSSSRRP